MQGVSKALPWVMKVQILCHWPVSPLLLFLQLLDIFWGGNREEKAEFRQP